MTIGRQVLIWFVSSMVAAAGARCAHYLAGKLSEGANPEGTAFTGSESRALCPSCGKPMKQFAKTLFCGNCGHRDA